VRRGAYTGASETGVTGPLGKNFDGGVPLLNSFILGVVVVCTTIAFGVVGVESCRTLIGGHVREGHNDVLVPLFLTAGVIYAVLLGFMVVAVWETYSDAHDNAAEEAATLVPLYRQTSDMAPDKRDEMRGILRDYTETIVKQEWGLMAATGQPSPHAQELIGRIYQVFGTLSPTTSIREITDAEFIRTVSSELVFRNKRLLQASESLSWIMWLGAIGGAVVTIGMTFILYMENKSLHLIAVGILSGLIGMLLYMLAILSHPFSGPLAIDPAAFEASLLTFQSIDHENMGP
jgi:hypothetical protein